MEIRLNIRDRVFRPVRAVAPPPRRDFSSFLGCEEGPEEKREMFIKEFRDRFDAETLLYPAASELELFNTAAQQTIDDIVPVAEKRRKGWFTANANRIMTLVRERNRLQENFDSLSSVQKSSAGAKDRLRTARRDVKRTVEKAKDEWRQSFLSAANNESNLQNGYRDHWKAVNALRRGLERPERPKSLRLRKPDGKSSATDLETLEILRDRFESDFNRPSTFDPTVLAQLPQVPVFARLAHCPSEEDVATVFSKSVKPGTSALGLQPEAFRILRECPKTMKMLFGFVCDFWASGVVFDEWLRGRLAVIPKKGDSSDPQNLRGLLVSGVLPKIIGVLIARKLQEAQESLGFKWQFGFSKELGCSDGHAAVLGALRKRAEHNLESYAFFLDLKKAFDSVDRAALYAVLLKFGIPASLVSLIENLHTGVRVSLSVGKEEAEFASKVGVKQGDSLAPVLFIFFVEACLRSLDSSSWDSPVFRTKNDFVMRGRSHVALGTEFEFPFAFYADDGAFVFCSRSDLESGVAALRAHFSRWSLEMHVGKNGADSKSVAIFFPAAGDPRETGDLSPVVLLDGANVPIVESFCYLGFDLHWKLSDDFAVESRISKANRCFGAIRKYLFSQRGASLQTKRSSYISIVLQVLLFGCENWALSEGALRKLRSFHNRCIRSMCRVNMTLTQIHHISSAELQKGIKIKPLDFYLLRRRIRWIGHVARRSLESPARMFLSSWVRNKRTLKSPKVTFGRSMENSLVQVKLPLRGSGNKPAWFRSAQNREYWRDMVAKIKV